MSKETAEDLKKAKALIDAPEKWTQGAIARDADGNEVMDSDPNACAFCMAGAIRKVVGHGAWWITSAGQAISATVDGRRSDVQR